MVILKDWISGSNDIVESKFFNLVRKQLGSFKYH